MIPSTAVCESLCTASIPAMEHASGRCSPRALHDPQPPFDVPVVGFDAAIRVAPGSMATTTMQLAGSAGAAQPE